MFAIAIIAIAFPKPSSTSSVPSERTTATMSHDAYKAYLQTPGWQSKRLQRFTLDNFQCQYCKIPILISTGHCHHLTYLRLGDEDIDDLVTLCRDCHHTVHSK